jgi:DNA-binding CsgD family transcriptional regulator
MDITVSFGKYSGENASDESQSEIARLIARKHPILRAQQREFDAYMRKAVKNLSKNVPWWDRTKSDKTDVWEIQDVTPSADYADGEKIDIEKIFTAPKNGQAILTEKEVTYLVLLLDGAKNSEIANYMEISDRQGKWVKKSIVKKLKKWVSAKDNETLADVLWAQVKKSEVSSIDISDLRHRKVFDVVDITDKLEQGLNKTIEAKKVTPVADYCPLKKRYSGRITAPVASLPAKISSPGQGWEMPDRVINQDYDVYGIKPCVTAIN